MHIPCWCEEVIAILVVHQTCLGLSVRLDLGVSFLDVPFSCSSSEVRMPLSLPHIFVTLEAMPPSVAFAIVLCGHDVASFLHAVVWIHPAWACIPAIW